MKNIPVICLLLLFLLGGRVGVCAQQPLHHTHAPFRELTLSQGLSDLLVNAIYKDSLGFVWFGTATAVDRFDGNRVHSYPFVEANEKLKRVNAIAETEGNQIWVGNGIGLWRINPTAVNPERVVADRINSPVYALWYDGSGSLYIGTGQGLFIYTRGAVQQVLMDNNLLSATNRIKGITGGAAGEVWLATDHGLFRYRQADQSREHFLPKPNELLFNDILNNIVCLGDTLYLGTLGQGIWTFDMKSRQFARFVDVGCNQISSLSSTGADKLYVGTDGNGVQLIDLPTRSVTCRLRHDNSSNLEPNLRSNSVYSLLVDRDGLMWVGFYQLGVDYTLYQDDLFTTYAYAPHFTTRDLPVRALSIQGSEKLIGSRDGLFYIDEARGRFKAFRGTEMRSAMIFTLLPYRGEYLVGTYGGGLYVFNPERLELRNFDSSQPDPFLDGHIFCMAYDHLGRLWIATSRGVYAYEKGKQIYHFTDANSKLPEGNVYALYFDSTHRGWFCTENGLCIFDPSTGKVRTDIFPEGFIHKEKVRVVYETSNHTLCFCPDKGPMFYSNLSMTKFYRQEPGTPLEGCDGQFIIEDQASNVWIGTNKGLVCRRLNGELVSYSYPDGIPDPVFTLCQPVCDEEGNLWMGNSKGLICLRKGRIEQPAKSSYGLRITDVKVSGQYANYAPSLHDRQVETLRLPAEENNLTFDFSDFSYSAPNFVGFEYQLMGKDNGWTQLYGASQVSYYGLPQNSYLFKVRKVGRPETETVLRVRISSPWWNGLWFALVGLLGVAASMWWCHHSNHRLCTDNQPEHPEDSSRQTQTLGEESNEEEQLISPEESLASTEKYRSFRLEEDECLRLTHRLDKLMRKEKLYINPNLKIADLADRLEISAHTLSYLFSQHLQRSYYDYINDYRIDEFKRIIKQEGQGKYTLSALAERCGFNSRASFFRYFKKVTGITPNEYIHQMEEEK